MFTGRIYDKVFVFDLKISCREEQTAPALSGAAIGMELVNILGVFLQDFLLILKLCDSLFLQRNHAKY